MTSHPTVQAPTPPAAIEITDAAVHALVHALAHAFEPDDDLGDLTPEDIAQIRGALAAVGPHLIAAELRRLVNITISDDTKDDVLGALRARADELDGGVAR